MIKNHDKLFELIKSLNKTEKRHFSNQNVANKDAIYFKIYKALDKMKAFDLQKLEKKVAKKDLANNLIYLNGQIFSSLRNLYKDKSLYLELLSNKTNINILMRKRLFFQADQLIDKNLKLCRKNNEFFLKTTLLETKFQLLKIRNQKVNYYQKSLELKAEYEEALMLMNKKLKLGYYVSTFMHLLEDDINVNEKEKIDIINDFINDKDFKEREYKLSLNYEWDRQILFTITYNKLRDYENSYKYSLEQYYLHLENEKVDPSFNGELYAISNVIESAVMINNGEKVEEFIYKLNDLNTKHDLSDINQKLIKLNVIVNKFYHFAMNIKYKDYKDSYLKHWRLFEQIQNDVQQNYLYPNAFIYAYILEFKGQKFEKALGLINTYYIESKDKERAQMNEYEELYRIICLFETGNTDVAIDLFNTYKRKKGKGSFNKEIINFLQVNLNNKLKEPQEYFSKIDVVKLNLFEMNLYLWSVNKMTE